MSNITECVSDLYEEYGYEEAKDIIKEAMDLIEDPAICRRAELEEELKQNSERLYEYVDELNEWLEEQVQEIINELNEQLEELEDFEEKRVYVEELNRSCDVSEIEDVAWEVLEKRGFRFYTKDNMTFKEFFNGPCPYWEVESDKISEGAFYGCTSNEKVDEFLKYYWKELLGGGTKFLDELDDIAKAELEQEVEMER